MAPKTWGLSKQAANYRPAAKPEASCIACKWMFPRLSVDHVKKKLLELFVARASP